MVYGNFVKTRCLKRLTNWVTCDIMFIGKGNEEAMCTFISMLG